jgi:hypothetical protein
VLLLIHGEKRDHMLKEDAVEKLVQKEVKRQVENQVAQAINDPQWVIEIENRITKFVQDRITARFSNISTVPDLVATVEQSVEKMFKDGFIPPIEHMVDNVLLEQAVDGAVEKLVTDTVQGLVLDPNWLTKIHNQISRDTSDRIKRGLKDVGMRGILREVVLENAGTIQEDLNREVTIEKGLVVVDNHLSSETMDTRSDVNIGGALVIEGELAVKGRISLSNPSFRELSSNIKQEALTELRTGFIEETSNSIRKSIQDGIDLKNILVRGVPLVENNILSPGIKITNIEQVGKLKELTVGSELKVANNRVGINTESPTSALSIWDNEVTIDIGKRSANNAQIGTSKAQDLTFITNNQEQMKIDKDGLTHINKLKLGRNRISTSDSTPGWSGAKGDIVFNYNYTPGGTFAWICIGDYRWSELVSA